MNIERSRKLLTLAVTLGILGAVSGCGTDNPSPSDNQPPSKFSLSESDSENITEAVFAVFNSPVDTDQASSYVCPEKRSENGGSSWDFTVERTTVLSNSDSKASVDVTLKNTKTAELTTTTVSLTKQEDKWVICG